MKARWSARSWSNPWPTTRSSVRPARARSSSGLLGPGGVVGEVLGQRIGLSGFGVDVEHDLRRSLSPQLALTDEAHSVSTTWSMPHASPIRLLRVR